MGTRFTDDNKDPAVNVTTWVLLVAIILSVLARLVTKFRLFHKLTTDDLLITASLVCATSSSTLSSGPIYNPRSFPRHSSDTRLEQVFAIAQNISVSVAVSHGYGKHIKEIPSNDWDSTMKVSGVG